MVVYRLCPTLFQVITNFVPVESLDAYVMPCSFFQASAAPQSTAGESGSAAASANGTAAPSLVTITRPEDVESVLEHALEVTAAEVSCRHAVALLRDYCAVW